MATPAEARQANGGPSSQPSKPSRLAVGVLGAGAPNSPLMAGALAYMYREGKTFDIFFTSGGGALIGLLFVAPGPGKRPDEALRDVVEFGIDERIYKAFPVGYKTFVKRGFFTEQIHGIADILKVDVKPRPFPGEAVPADYDAKSQQRKRFYNDLIDLWALAVTPPRIGPRSLGLCEPLPYLEELIDFRAANSAVSPSGLNLNIPIPITLPASGPGSGLQSASLRFGWFYVNAYNLAQREIHYFSNSDPKDAATGYAGSLTPEAIRAALSFPFIYPPQEIKGEPYCEGALVDPLNLPRAIPIIARMPEGTQLLKSLDPSGNVPEVTFYLFDILGSLETQLMYSPRDLWEAYGLSILTPVISLAKCSETIFTSNPSSPRLEKVSFKIPRASKDRPLEWTYRNMSALWDAGWEAGKTFVGQFRDHLPNRRPN